MDRKLYYAAVSLYPALHKLEQEGWITAKWQLAKTGRRAKFYSLSRALIPSVGRLTEDAPGSPRANPPRGR